MSADEQIKALEVRVTQLEMQLESELAKRVAKSESTQFQRMVYDERGRGIVVAVGGNN